MSIEEQGVEPPRPSAFRSAAFSQRPGSPAVRPLSPSAGAAAVGETVRMQVSWMETAELPTREAQVFELLPDRWERVQIPLRQDWRGGGLRLEPHCRLALLEIVGLRVSTGALTRPIWEKLGRDLVAEVQVSAGTQVLSNQLRLRLLCVGEDARITLPELSVPSAEMPLTLEIGLRLRTDLRLIGYALHEWVDDANTRGRELEGRLRDAEQARRYEESRAAGLLTEIDLARADGNQREAALQQQLSSAHEAAHDLAATLRAEIEAARSDGQRREAAGQAQLAAAHQAARAEAAALLAEVEAARLDGQRREAAAKEQLAASHEAARAQAAVLLAEVDAARVDGAQREAAAREQLAAAHAAAQAQAAALTAEIQDGQQRNDLLQGQVQVLREDNARLAQQAARIAQEAAWREAASSAQLAEAHRVSEENRGRVQSMQKSLSWRVTLPWRMLVRALTGRRPARNR